MPRAIWKGVISFGMVSIPVKLLTATQSRDIAFRQLHEEDNARVRMLRWCPVEEREIPFDEIVKGYEYAKDRYVVLTDEDFEKLPLASKHTVSLTAFVDASEIDPLQYEKSYYLEPEETGVKPFALLVKSMEKKGLVAIAKIAIRQKEQLCALRVRDGGLVLETLYYPDEIRSPETQPADVEVSEQEMEMASALIDMLHEPFDPEKFTDEYREALMSIITAKLEGEEVVVPEEPVAQPAVDLMAALRASVEAAKARKDGSTEAREEAAVASD